MGDEKDEVDFMVSEQESEQQKLTERKLDPAYSSLVLFVLSKDIQSFIVPNFFEVFFHVKPT